MMFARINRPPPEQFYYVCRNIAGTTAEIGEAAAFDYGIGGAADGVQANTPQADCLYTGGGVWSDITPRSDYGRVQVYGHADSIRFGGSTFTPGMPAKFVADKSYFAPVIVGYSGMGDSNDYDSHLAVLVCGSTMLTPAAASTGLRPGFIKGM